jgi:hypothetical protein
MKTIRAKNNTLAILAMISSLASPIGRSLSHAQETTLLTPSAARDSIVQLTADSLGLPQISPYALPRSGTFWLALPGGNGGILAPAPCPPLDPTLPVYSITPGQFLVDGTGGQALLNNRFAANSTVNSALAAQAAGVVNLVEQVQAAASGGLLPAGGGGVAFGEDSLPRPVYTTNDLWLELTGKTNKAVYLTIHPPWNEPNGVYDLYYTTNLSSPQSWSWVLRSFAGLTNLVVNNAVDAQGFYRLGPLNDPVGHDSLGTNFWVAFFDMYGYYFDGGRIPTRLSLYISSPVGASGTVAIPGYGTTNFTVAAGAVTNVSIPTNVMIGSDWMDQVGNYGIHVTASAPVSVYAMDYAQTVSGAFTVYPTSLLGTNYCVMASLGYSEFGIVAVAAGTTTVTITPGAYGWGGSGLYGSTWMSPISLTNGQTYQNQCYKWDYDLTGLRIASDKPIAVFAGAKWACMPDGATAAYNPVVQEQLPVEDWGTMALALSFAGRTNGDNFRVLAAYDNTMVTITGKVVTITAVDVFPRPVTKTNETVVTNLMAGQFCDIIVDGPAEFLASKPIQVAHFANGWEFDHTSTYEGDPCETLLLPIGHYLETNIVFTPFYNTNSTGDFDENFMNLIVAQSATNSTFVDTLPVVVTNFVPIGTSGYYGAWLSVTNGTHTVTSSRPVGVEVYGWGQADAYGYFGGVVK